MTDSQAARPRSSIPVPLVALCGWLVPGLGYWLIGEKKRALIVGITILFTYALGLLIGNVRVVDVPGYDKNGVWKTVILAGSGETASAMRAQPAAEIMEKPWYIAQTLMGPVNLLATWGSIATAQADHPQSTSRIFDIGTLYTAVAGMLNLLALIDAAHRTTQPQDDDLHNDDLHNAHSPEAHSPQAPAAQPSPATQADNFQSPGIDSTLPGGQQ